MLWSSLILRGTVCSREKGDKISERLRMQERHWQSHWTISHIFSNLCLSRGPRGLQRGILIGPTQTCILGEIFIPFCYFIDWAFRLIFQPPPAWGISVQHESPSVIKHQTCPAHPNLLWLSACSNVWILSPSTLIPTLGSVKTSMNLVYK